MRMMSELNTSAWLAREPKYLGAGLPFVSMVAHRQLLSLTDKRLVVQHAVETHKGIDTTDEGGRQ